MDETNQLLLTKLNIPPARAKHISRSHLIQRLDEGLRLGQRLILVSAPPGYGKTTLLGDWARMVNVPVAWVSLDESDNDPVRFWTYLVTSFQRAYPGLGEGLLALIQPSHSPGLDSTFLASLINAMAAQENSFVLVLDDYHNIQSQTLHKSIAYLIDYLPASVCIVLNTRSDPPLPLSRFRARNQLVEIRAEDLRFTSTEIGTYLNEIVELNLSADLLEILEKRTEGWPAGLVMAALSLQGRADVKRFSESFTGSHRYVMSFLVDEVLSQLPASLQTFLMETSILDRLTATLCEHVTGQANAQSILVDLDRGNLFVIPLEDEQRWYRYHPLFSDVLRTRLLAAHADHVPVLHQRAAAWYEESGLFGKAVDHSLQIPDYYRAARLVEKAGGPMLSAGEWKTLQDWLDRLPRDTLESHPVLSLFQTWLLLLSGKTEALDVRFLELEQLLERAEANQLESFLIRDWRGQLAAMRSYLAAREGDTGTAIEQANQALALLPEDNLVMRGVIAANLGATYFNIGKIEAASQILAEAQQTSQQAGNQATALSSASLLAQVEEEQGNLHTAAAGYRRVLQEARQYPPIRGNNLVRLGTLAYEWNQLDEAREYYQDALAIANQFSISELELIGTLALAHTLLAAGEPGAAQEAMQHSITLIPGIPAPTLVGYGGAQIARFFLARNDPTSALHWAKETFPEGVNLSLLDQSVIPFLSEICYTTQARIYMATGSQQEAQQIIKPLIRIAQAGRRKKLLVECLALQALVYHRGGDARIAMQTIGQALVLAGPEGYVRTFVDEGQPMFALVNGAVTNLKVDEMIIAYMHRLRAAFKMDLRNRPASAPPVMQDQAEPSGALVEALSDRELEVLQLMARGLTNQEIATELVVSLGTVKAHAHHIYDKLNVQNRTHAVARAREMNLLSVSE